jgi:hypothetical protein
MTYSVPFSAVPGVYDSLAGPRTRYPERFFEAHNRPPRTVLHFYLAATEGVSTRRLRVWRRGGGLAIALESKRVVREDALSIEKEEITENPDLTLQHAAGILSADASVISSFIKNKYRFKLQSASGLLKVSLDQMLPFQADDPALLGSQFWHLEIEEAGGWPLSDFHETAFFLNHLAHLPPLRQSKWQLAMTTGPVRIGTSAAKHLPEYFSELLAKGERERLAVRHS